ncbi:hypothetical protein F4803DRAFT_380405 [Xylaria telfairii]|nr:hypothetical protein F4803DRAFT_380405 [Xylaria telfairii]
MRENYGILRAVSIDVYIGYGRCGVSGSDPGDTELRKGKWVLTHHEWYDKQERDCDIAMIRLTNVFDHPRKFIYSNETPKRGREEEIYVVGYPSDIPLDHQHHMSEDSKGKVMYQSSKKITWDLDNPNIGLTYRADTYAGNSGGPVLRYNGATLEVIGVHTCGNKSSGLNSATKLGHYGNHLPTFLDALNKLQGNIQGTALPNGRFCNDKVEGWPQGQILTLPYVRPQ